MSETTGISWTDSTWSPVTGCKAVSPGCANCFAATLAATRLKKHPAYAGLAHLNDAGRAVWSGEVRLHPDRLRQPSRWRKPRRIFVCDMSDLFHPDVPDEFLDQAFAAMAVCPQHTFQVLTKRPEKMRDYVLGADGREIRFDIPGRVMDREPFDWPLPNVWLGVSVEDQQRADERVPVLLRTPAAVRFLSVEPLLGPVNLHCYLGPCVWGGTGPRETSTTRGIDWVIVGGESSQAGQPARPCDLAWIRSIVAQCRAAQVACWVKQLGSSALDAVQEDGQWKLDRLSFRHRAGADPAEWPAELRVQEFPR